MSVTLTVMTFNLHDDQPPESSNSWEKRRDLCISVITSYSPAILCTQQGSSLFLYSSATLLYRISYLILWMPCGSWSLVRFCCNNWSGSCLNRVFLVGFWCFMISFEFWVVLLGSFNGVVWPFWWNFFLWTNFNDWVQYTWSRKKLMNCYHFLLWFLHFSIGFRCEISVGLSSAGLAWYVSLLLFSSYWVRSSFCTFSTNVELKFLTSLRGRS